MAQAAFVAAELRVADLLASGPRDVEALSRFARCDERSLRRLMRALATLDIVAERDDGSFELRPIGALLRANSRSSLRAWTILWGRRLWPAWGNLLHSIRTGESHGAALSQGAAEGFFDADAETAAIFGEAMVELTRLVSEGVAGGYDFSRARRIVDVGGGFGELLAAILHMHPDSIGVLFDLPGVIQNARARHAGESFAGRCKFVSGDFFDAVPPDGDAYVLKSVLHDWPDEPAVRILRNCRRAMGPHARLLVVERIMSMRMTPSRQSQTAAWSDLNMLVATGGRERTEAEMRDLLGAAELQMIRALPAGLGFSIIEAQPFPPAFATSSEQHQVTRPPDWTAGPAVPGAGGDALHRLNHSAMRAMASAALVAMLALAVWWSVGTFVQL